MENAAVVPDGKVVGVLPAMTNLKVMVVRDEVDEASQSFIAFLLGETIDTLHMMANAEDTLPASDRVCADDGVNSC